MNLIYLALIFLFIKNYGPFLILFDSHKLAVLTLELIMSSVIRCGNSGVPLMKLMLELGNALESEYKVSILKGSKDNSLGWARKLLKASSAGNSLRTFVKIKRSLNDNEEWPAELKVIFVIFVIRLHVI